MKQILKHRRGNTANWVMEHQSPTSTRRKVKKRKEKKSQPASVNLPFSFVSFIAVGTYETADRSEVSNPCAVLSVQPTALCGLRVVLSGETTSWVMFVKVYLVFPQTMTALFM